MTETMLSVYDHFILVPPQGVCIPSLQRGYGPPRGQPSILPSHGSSSRQFKLAKGLYTRFCSLGSKNLLHEMRDLQLASSLFFWPWARGKDSNRIFEVSRTKKAIGWKDLHLQLMFWGKSPVELPDSCHSHRNSHG